MGQSLRQRGRGSGKTVGGLAGRGRIVLTRPLQQQKRWIALERVDNALECVRIDRCCWQNGRDHCGNAAGMVRANVLAASTRRRAAMGKCIEIDHVLHAGKMVPRRWDGGQRKIRGRSLERVVAFSAVRGAIDIPNVELQTSFACVTLEGRGNYFAV